jgi:hypothetical protein
VHVVVCARTRSCVRAQADAVAVAAGRQSVLSDELEQVRACVRDRSTYLACVDRRAEAEAVTGAS